MTRAVDAPRLPDAARDLDALFVGEGLMALTAEVGLDLALRLDLAPGGLAGDAAMACARRGATTALASAVGTDTLGRRLVAAWESAGAAATSPPPQPAVTSASDSSVPREIVLLFIRIPVARAVRPD